MHSRKLKQHAFTLIELLVVLVIIGVVIAAASLLFSSDRRGEENEKAAVDLFRGRTQLAQQEAILSTSTLGVALSQQGYQFYRYIEVLPSRHWTWQTITKDKVLAYHRWPVNASLSIETATSKSTLLGNVIPTTPQIIFYPSGQITGFTVTMNNQYQIIGQDNGSISASAINN